MRKFLAVLLFIIMVFPLLFAAEVTAGVSSWALDRDFYLEALDQPEVYAAFADSPLIEQVIKDNMYLPASFEAIELSSLINSAVTPDYLKTQIENIINEYFDYIQGKADAFTPVVDLSPMKAALLGPNQDMILRAIVAALPECQPGQVPSIGGSLENLCKPVGDSDELLIQYFIQPSLPFMVAQLPDEMPLENVVPEINDVQQWQLAVPGMAVPASLILGVIAVAFVALIAWYVTALIADGSWHFRLQWLGWMLLIPSILVFALGFALPSSISAYWINFGLERATLDRLSYGPQLIELVRSAADSMLPRIGSAFQMAGGVCGAFALAFIFWGIATPRKKKETAV